MTSNLARWSCRLAPLDDGSGPVLVACSGGADSLALLALLHDLGVPVTAGHIDHGLRSGSDLEFATVERAAAELGIAARSQRIVLEPGANLEARARDRRYEALEAMADELGCVTIATGHTLDDQAETVLLATLRGAGIDGLSGIALRRGRLWRPQLCLRRHDTLEICRLLAWVPVDDPMNDDVAFRRVWLRREVLPALSAGADRDLATVLARQAVSARADREVLDDLASGLLVAAAVDVAAGHLDAAVLLAAPIAVQRRAVRSWIGFPVDLAHVDAVLDVVAGSRTAVDVGRALRVRRSAGALFREPIAPTPVPQIVAVECPVPGRAEFAGFEIVTRVEACPPVGWPTGMSSVVLDADAVGDRVELRLPVPTDTFVAVGSRRPRTITATRKDAGLPIGLRQSLPIVARPDGTILWALGYGGAATACVTQRTSRYCWMSATVV